MVRNVAFWVFLSLSGFLALTLSAETALAASTSGDAEVCECGDGCSDEVYNVDETEADFSYEPGSFEPGLLSDAGVTSYSAQDPWKEFLEACVRLWRRTRTSIDEAKELIEAVRRRSPCDIGHPTGPTRPTGPGNVAAPTSTGGRALGHSPHGLGGGTGHHGQNHVHVYTPCVVGGKNKFRKITSWVNPQTGEIETMCHIVDDMDGPG